MTEESGDDGGESGDDGFEGRRHSEDEQGHEDEQGQRGHRGMKKAIIMEVNGSSCEVEVEPWRTLLDVVREELDLTGAKLGCDIQVCGACTLLVDGKPVSACSVLAVDADGRKVTTVEGLAEGDRLHPLQESFMKFGALQCGYCTSGFLLTAKAMLDENPHPDDEQIKSYMGGSFCRCGCYQEIMQAIRNVVRA